MRFNCIITVVKQGHIIANMTSCTMEDDVPYRTLHFTFTFLQSGWLRHNWWLHAARRQLFGPSTQKLTRI